MLVTHPPHPSDGPPVRVHLTAATLDAAAAVCEVRGLPHLVARLDRAANEIRSQEDMDAEIATQCPEELSEEADEGGK